MKLLKQQARQEGLKTTLVKRASGVAVDVCIVGGGVTGIAVARDAASCGYSSVVVERGGHIGGVWAANDYPGLR